MKLSTWLVALTALAAITASVYGGDYKKCDASTEECLTAMAEKIRSKGWLGIETEKNADGRYAVTAVTADSPAAEAGFRAGDVLFALNGVELSSENKKKLAKVKKSLGPGAKADYVVLRGESKTKLVAELAPVPDTVMAQWIGQHMLDQHAYVTVAAR
ncbi:MAG: PDZ domain-containing protein [Acidobacteriota bacterium]